MHVLCHIQHYMTTSHNNFSLVMITSITASYKVNALKLVDDIITILCVYTQTKQEVYENVKKQLFYAGIHRFSSVLELIYTPYLLLSLIYV